MVQGSKQFSVMDFQFSKYLMRAILNPSGAVVYSNKAEVHIPLGDGTDTHVFKYILGAVVYSNKAEVHIPLGDGTDTHVFKYISGAVVYSNKAEVHIPLGDGTDTHVFKRKIMDAPYMGLDCRYLFLFNKYPNIPKNVYVCMTVCAC